MMTWYRTSGFQSWLTKAFNLSILEKTRMTWVDYLRGIAIVLVVYHHVRIGVERSGIVVPTLLVHLNTIFYSFRMPLFFILSGIFINQSLTRKSTGQLLGIKFEKLLYPYFIWSFIQVTFQIVLSRYSNSGRTLLDYTYMFYQPRALDQFWYLPALFNATAVYLLIRKFLRPSATGHILMAIGIYCLAPFFQQWSMMLDWMRFYIFFTLGGALSPYFFKERFQAVLQNRYSILWALPFFAVSQYYYLTHKVGEEALHAEFAQATIPYFTYLLHQVQYFVVGLIGCITMLLVAFRLQKWNVLAFLRVLGYHSLYIYVMHVLVVAFTRIVLVNVLHIHTAILLLPAGIFMGLVIPVMFYNVCVKDGFAWFLFSYHRPRRKEATPSGAIHPEVVVVPERSL
jgi:uncharacterized membrane protein YcfT